MYMSVGRSLRAWLCSTDWTPVFLSLPANMHRSPSDSGTRSGPGKSRWFPGFHSVGVEWEHRQTKWELVVYLLATLFCAVLTLTSEKSWPSEVQAWQGHSQYMREKSHSYKRNTRDLVLTLHPALGHRVGLGTYSSCPSHQGLSRVTAPMRVWPHGLKPPDFSVHGIFQARILEWEAISSPRDLPDPWIEPRSPASADTLFTTAPSRNKGQIWYGPNRSRRY